MQHPELLTEILSFDIFYTQLPCTIYTVTNFRAMHFLADGFKNPHLFLSNTLADFKPEHFFAHKVEESRFKHSLT